MPQRSNMKKPWFNCTKTLRTPSGTNLGVSNSVRTRQSPLNCWKKSSLQMCLLVGSLRDIEFIVEGRCWGTWCKKLKQAFNVLSQKPCIPTASFKVNSTKHCAQLDHFYPSQSSKHKHHQSPPLKPKQRKSKERTKVSKLITCMLIA